MAVLHCSQSWCHLTPHTPHMTGESPMQTVHICTNYIVCVLGLNLWTNLFKSRQKIVLHLSTLFGIIWNLRWRTLPKDMLRCLDVLGALDRYWVTKHWAHKCVQATYALNSGGCGGARYELHLRPHRPPVNYTGRPSDTNSPHHHRGQCNNM